MQKIIENLLSPELLPALDANMIMFWSIYGRASGCTLQTRPKCVWFYTGIKSPLFNGVLYANLEATDVKQVIEELQMKIDQQGAPAFWWVSPRSKPDNLNAMLKQQGLQPAGEIPAMAVELGKLADKHETMPDFSIEKVSDNEMQKLWARIAATGTGFSDVAIDGMVRVESDLNVPEYREQQRYIGFLKGIPVSSSALVLDSGVAGIYAVATMPEVRHKGIGSLMTVMPLQKAKETGYRIGILQASPMGYAVYRKIGFEEVCKYNLYIQT